MTSLPSGMPPSDSEIVIREADASSVAPDRPHEAGGVLESKSPRRLAVVRSYYELVDAFRNRVLELGTDYEEVDRVAGYCDTYTSKLLAPRPSRNFGEVSLGSMLGALGLELHVVENPVATEKARARLKQRDFAAYEPAPTVLRFPRRHFKRIGKLGAAGYLAKVSPEKRSEYARNAVLKRWRRPVIQEITPGHEKGPAGVSSRAKSGKRAPRRKGPQPDRKTQQDIGV
jgi:hypothetical protein